MRQNARLRLKSSGNFRSETGGSDFQACWTAPLSPPAEPDLVYEIVPQPDSSVSKESACNAGDPGSIPGSGRSPGEGIGYPLQCSWASFVAQLVKNPPAMRETWVRSLGWEDPLKKGKATYFSILTWRIPWTIQSMGSQAVRQD